MARTRAVSNFLSTQLDTHFVSALQDCSKHAGKTSGLQRQPIIVEGKARHCSECNPAIRGPVFTGHEAKDSLFPTEHGWPKKRLLRTLTFPVQ